MNDRSAVSIRIALALCLFFASPLAIKAWCETLDYSVEPTGINAVIPVADTPLLEASRAGITQSYEDRCPILGQTLESYLALTEKSPPFAAPVGTV